MTGTPLPRALADHFRELYRARGLVQVLAAREVVARYRGSVAGFFWTLLNPLMLLLVYRLVFTKYTRAVDLPNYSVFAFVGILPWLWLSSALGNGAVSISQGGALITRACMPPQTLPAVSVLSNLANFAFALPVALAAGLVFGIFPGPSLLALPLAIAIQLAFLYGVALTLASLNVRFRDVSLLTQSVIQIWFFLTPIVLPLSDVPDQYRWLVLINPATAVIEPYQAILYFGRWPDPALLAAALAWATGAIALGIRVFDAQRDFFAEEI